MSIKAKYAGTCRKCGASFPAGTEIEWSKGEGSRHLKCPAAPKGTKPPAGRVFLNSPKIETAGAQTLTDAQAAEILAREGRQFMRPLPTGAPALSVGHKVTIEGKEIEIGRCGNWVGMATDWSTYDRTQPTTSPREHIVSLIDGSILESGDHGKTKGINYWTRQLGAPQSMERGGKNSVQAGEIVRQKDGSSWLVTTVRKSYYLSADAAEDMDLFDRGGGWATPFEMREVTLSQAERDADAAKEQAKRAAEAITNFERRITHELPMESRIETPREGLTILRRWSTAKHPSYGSPYYRSVSAVNLADGRIGYRFTDSFYDWPQDFVAIVSEFFSDEPPATEVK
jgi:hypothetical protein